MKETHVIFEADGEKLAGCLVTPEQPRGPQILFVHGAGGATKERALPIAQQLASTIHASSFLFDFSGHGESTGTLGESSLERRLNQARAAVATAGFVEPLIICGFSMGAHVAIELMAELPVHTLVLFYPAVYAQEARSIHFGESRFSEMIRQKNSWETSRAFEELSHFHGNLLVIAGEKDEVIPPQVIQLIASGAPQARKTRLTVIPNAPHALLSVLYEQPDLFKEICGAIGDFAS